MARVFYRLSLYVPIYRDGEKENDDCTDVYLSGEKERFLIRDFEVFFSSLLE